MGMNEDHGYDLGHRLRKVVSLLLHVGGINSGNQILSPKFRQPI
jgi:hypothetical protein